MASWPNGKALLSGDGLGRDRGFESRRCRSYFFLNSFLFSFSSLVLLVLFVLASVSHIEASLVVYMHTSKNREWCSNNILSFIISASAC